MLLGAFNKQKALEGSTSRFVDASSGLCEHEHVENAVNSCQSLMSLFQTSAATINFVNLILNPTFRLRTTIAVNSGVKQS